MKNLAFSFGLAVLCALQLAAADPFYEQRLREGKDAFSRGDHANAETALELAAFGFLDDLDRLPEALVRLALAQAANGKADDFRDTFRRVLEIEERFQAYSRADLPADLERQLEAVAAREIAPSLVASVPAFAGIGREVEQRRIAGLPVEDRRRALAAKALAEPEEPSWRLLLAELEMAARRPAAALEALAAAPAAAELDPRTACLRGEALLDLDRCGEALEPLATCKETTRRSELAAGLLDCQLDSGRLEAAEDLLGRLVEPALSSKEVARAKRRLDRERPAARTASPQAPAPTATPPMAAERQPAGVAAVAPGPASPADGKLAASDEAAIAEARRLLAQARRAGDLQQALALAKEVADRHPGETQAQHLTAEIAYRASRWSDAAEYFRRGGDPGDGRPTLLFFMAVSYFETGDLEAARSVLERALPKLQKTEFVTDYSRKIFAGGAP